MARLETNKLTIFRRQGKWGLREVPDTVRQSSATRQAAVHFGQAVTLSRLARAAFQPLFTSGSDRALINRFNRAFINWLRETAKKNNAATALKKHVASFPFYAAASVTDRLRFKLSVNRSHQHIEIKLPAYNPVSGVIAPAHTKQVKWELIVISCGLKAKKLSGKSNHRFTVAYTDRLQAERIITLPLRPIAGNLVMVAASLTYHYPTKGDMVAHPKPRWQPAGMIAAWIE